MSAPREPEPCFEPLSRYTMRRVSARPTSVSGLALFMVMNFDQAFNNAFPNDGTQKTTSDRERESVAFSRVRALLVNLISLLVT